MVGSYEVAFVFAVEPDVHMVDRMRGSGFSDVVGYEQKVAVFVKGCLGVDVLEQDEEQEDAVHGTLLFVFQRKLPGWAKERGNDLFETPSRKSHALIALIPLCLPF